MSLDIVSELESLVEELAASGIEYAVCGGFAVNIHGHVRATRDIDLLIRPESLDEARRVARRLGFTLEAGPIPFASGTAQSRELYRSSKASGSEILTLDLMLVAPVFEKVWTEREAFEWRGHIVSAVSLSGLVEMKRLAGRKQDLADIENLGVNDEEA